MILSLANDYNGRYPQEELYNPVGNTKPEDAYFSYFAPTLDGTNTASANNWGGSTWGSKKLATGVLLTQHNLSSTAEYRQYLSSELTKHSLAKCGWPMKKMMVHPASMFLLIT